MAEDRRAISSDSRLQEESWDLQVQPVRKNSSMDSDFGVDLEEEDDVDTLEEPLSWRMDPETSLSDWTIVISGQDSGSSSTYHVHRNILAVGRCKSDYFASLFRNAHRLAESNTNTSQITMEDSAAKVFPSLLDFLYSHRIEIATNNAVPLRHLAQYFGIRLLRAKVMDFVRKDMKLDTVSTYIRDALVFHDERLLSLAADICVNNIRSIDKSSPLLASIDPWFFLRILSSAEIDTCDESSDISLLVTAYCNHHETELDAATFEQLTSKKHMPLIHRCAALPLLQLEGSIRDASELYPPSCLQKRCTKVLSHYWESLVNGERKLESSFKELPSPILAELLEKCLLAANQTVHDKEEKHKVQLQNVNDTCDEQLLALQDEKTKDQEEVKKIKKDSNEKISQLRAAVAERDRQMMEYEKELSKFVRVPVTHSFRSVERDTYHHLSGNEPFDTGANHHDRYGRNRPLAIPHYADSTEDGYLFSERNGTTCDQWPIYYYKDE